MSIRPRSGAPKTGETLADDLRPLYVKARAGAVHGVVIAAPTGDRDMGKSLRPGTGPPLSGLGAGDVLLDAAESQAVGVPAVARPIGAVKERFTDRQSGFLAADDDAFVENVLAMLTDDEAFRTASGIARRSGRARGWDAAASEFETLFR